MERNNLLIHRDSGLLADILQMTSRQIFLAKFMCFVRYIWQISLWQVIFVTAIINKNILIHLKLHFYGSFYMEANFLQLYNPQKSDLIQYKKN